MAYRDVILADSPIEYWEMSEASGSSVASSGSGAHGGTATGTTVVAGRVGNARDFNGSSDSIAFASVTDFAAGTNYSMEGWFKTTTTDTNGKDWLTILRRDGSGVAILMRVAGSTSGIQQGAVQTYINGRIVSTGTTRFDNGSWHHVVVTKAGTTVKLFVDGVEYTTASGTHTAGGTGTANPVYAGSSGGTSEIFDGSLDELAIYTTALNTTQISNHYAAPGSGGYTAQPMTLNGSMPEPMVNGVFYMSVVDDTWVTDSSATNNSSATDLTFGTGPTRWAFMHISTPTIPSGWSLSKAELILTNTATSFDNFVVENVSPSQTWDATTINGNNEPGIGSLISSTSTGGGVVPSKGTADITSIISAFVAGTTTNTGIRVRGLTGVRTVASKENSTESYRPSLRITLIQTQSGGYSAQPMTSSSLMVDPTIDATDTVSVSGQPMQVSAVFVEPVVDADQFVDVTFNATPMLMDIMFQTGSGYSESVSNTADVFLITNGDMIQPAVTVEKSAVHNASAMTASALLNVPELVNGEPIEIPEGEDKFFQRVIADNPGIWFRLNDQGSTAVSQDGDDQGVYNGVLTGRHDGPDNRHSVRFTGNSMFSQTEPPANEVGSLAGNTLEFYFKTEKSDTFLMAGLDARSGQAATLGLLNELYLRNGKISMKSWDTTAVNNTNLYKFWEFTGFTNLADNQWHQIVIRQDGQTGLGGQSGVTIWVDGKFEIRRTNITGFPSAAFGGFPDYIGSRPTGFNAFGAGQINIDALPSSQNFVGDMSEVVVYYHSISDHSVTRHYYDFMAWSPIEAQPFETFVFATADNKGRGNQKRALALYWYNTNDYYDIGGGSHNGKNSMSFDPFVTGRPDTFYDHKVFWKSVQSVVPGEIKGDIAYRDSLYRDPVTDLPTIFNLDLDVNIEDFDVIMFKDWPDEGTEFDSLNSYLGGRFQQEYERLLDQLVKANRDYGVGLYVTHPRLAADLGIVGQVEDVPTFDEGGIGGRGTDYASALKYPWNIAGDSRIDGVGNNGDNPHNGKPMNLDPAFLARKSEFYGDSNKNDRFRVRAIVEGLTDLPSYMIQEAISAWDAGTWAWHFVAYKYLHRLSGLQIGDEYIFEGTDMGLDMDAVSADYNQVRAGRWFGYKATPGNAVLAGTVVTTFGEKFWTGTSQVDNPYKDYATTIILQPGDRLRGQVLSGRVYCNFTEAHYHSFDPLPVQEVPDAGGYDWMVNKENAAQMEWDYSGTRAGTSVTNVPGSTPGSSVEITNPDGSTTVIQLPGTPNNNNLPMIRSNQLYPLTWYPRLEMNARGFLWLGQADEVNEGDENIAAEPITTSAVMVDPVVVAEKDIDVNAQAMVMNAVMPKVAEDESGDADTISLPMTVSLEMTGYGKTISAEPMVVTVEMVENFDMVHASGEQVVVYLHGVDATLYIKEEN